MEWKYGEQPIRDSDLQTAQAVHLHLEQLLQSRMNPVSYFVIRILLE